MSVIEDVRQALQDIVAPEMRAFHDKLDAIETKLDIRLESLDGRLHSRI